MIRNLWIRLVLFAAGAMALAAPAIADTPSFTLRYGVLAGLTGDPAPSGQGWNEAARLGIDSIAQTLKSMGLNSIQVVLADSQDSQGNPQAGVEAAQKLVQIDHVNVIIGDFYSSVTTAVATAVTIPNQVLIFTGGTSPALTKLNTGPVPLVWQPVAADDLQGRVLAQVIGEALGVSAKINVGARNDALRRRTSPPCSRMPGRRAAARSPNSLSTTRRSQPSTARRSNSSTAIPTAGCSSISATRSRSSRCR